MTDLSRPERRDAERRIQLEGAFNFRDLGGYPAADGRRVAWRRLFRADGLARLTDGDLARLDDLGIATVVDLRTPMELERAPTPAVPSSPDVHHLPMFDVLPDEEELPDWVDARFLIGRYSQMLDDGRNAVAEAIRVLASPGAVPAVFHCTAGKDRTGILAAVVLGLLGVPDESIVADYELSRDAMVQFLEHLRATLREEQRAGLDRREDAILAARPEVMAGLLDHVRSAYGSFEGLASAFGAGDAVEPLRAALLV